MKQILEFTKVQRLELGSERNKLKECKFKFPAHGLTTLQGRWKLLPTYRAERLHKRLSYIPKESGKGYTQGCKLLCLKQISSQEHGINSSIQLVCKGASSFRHNLSLRSKSSNDNNSIPGVNFTKHFSIIPDVVSCQHVT